MTLFGFDSGRTETHRYTVFDGQVVTKGRLPRKEHLRIMYGPFTCDDCGETRRPGELTLHYTAFVLFGIEVHRSVDHIEFRCNGCHPNLDPHP